MIRIRFTMERNGYENVVDVTYGNYSSFEKAAAQISKEVDEIASANVGYFANFHTKMIDGMCAFGWTDDWNIQDILYNNGFAIWDKENEINWEIVVETETTLEGKKIALENY